MTSRPTSWSSAATASSSRSAQPTARPISSAALLGGEGVDAEALGLQLPAAVGLEEVEDRGGAGDRQDAGGLEHVDRLGDAADAAARPRRCDWRSAAPRSSRPTSDSTASTSSPIRAGLGRRGAHHPLARLDQDREALDRLEGRGETAAGRRAWRWPLRPRTALALTFPLLCGLVDSMRDWLPHGSSAGEDARFSRPHPQK